MMKWCDWCKCYHGPKAEHISKTMWLLPVDTSSDDSSEYLLFPTKKKAKRMGFDGAPFKVRITPESKS